MYLLPCNNHLHTHCNTTSYINDVEKTTNIYSWKIHFSGNKRVYCEQNFIDALFISWDSEVPILLFIPNLLEFKPCSVLFYYILYQRIYTLSKYKALIVRPFKILFYFVKFVTNLRLNCGILSFTSLLWKYLFLKGISLYFWVYKTVSDTINPVLAIILYFPIFNF